MNPVRPGYRIKDRQAQLLLDRIITQEALHCIDGQGFVLVAAIAMAFTRVRTNAPQSRGKRVYRGDRSPGCFKSLVFRNTGLVRLRHDTDPATYIPAIGAGVLTRRQGGRLFGPVRRRNGTRCRAVFHFMFTAQSCTFRCREISAFRSRMRCDMVFRRLTASNGSSRIRVSRVRLSIFKTRA